MIRRTLMLLLVALFGRPTEARAHFDVVPYADGGRIATGGHDDVLNLNAPRLRVFGFDFGEDPLDPFVIGDPGFNNGAGFGSQFPNDGLLPAGATLSIDVATGLLYWSGAGAVALGPAPAGVELGLKRGNSELRVSASGGVGTAPTIGSAGPLGRLHVHLESLLYQDGDAGSGTPNAPDGIYVVGVTLGLTPQAFAASDVLYLVYNHNLSEASHDEAIDYVTARLVPEPGALVLGVCGLAALLMLARCPRRSASGRRGSAGRGSAAVAAIQQRACRTAPAGEAIIS